MKTPYKILLICISLAIILIFVFNGLILLDRTETYYEDVKYINTSYTVGSPDTNLTHNYKAQIAVVTVKTSGGLPFLKNDVYQTIAITFSPGVFDGNSWTTNMYVMGIGASRINGSDDKTYSCKSQNLSFCTKYGDQNRFWAPHFTFAYPYNGITDESINRIFSEPDADLSHSSSFVVIGNIKPHANLSRLTSSIVIDELSNYTPFEYNNTTFINKAKYIITTNQSKYSRVFSYVDTPWGGMTDCGYLAQDHMALSPSQPSDMYVISTLNWGLFDKSEAVIHLKITAPDLDPKKIREGGDKYGIYNINGTPWTDNIVIEVI